jgi:hypothetical protein
MKVWKRQKYKDRKISVVRSSEEKRKEMNRYNAGILGSETYTRYFV